MYGLDKLYDTLGKWFIIDYLKHKQVNVKKETAITAHDNFFIT